jgi:pterin-4a-carbinolamine dehydratase
MKEYFSDGGKPMIKESLPATVPIEVKKSEWRLSEEKKFLLRKFEFDNEEQLRWFVSEILLMQSENKHHAYILIDEKSVNIKVGTKSLGTVTEMDIEYAAGADSIYEDAKQITADESD